MAHSWRVHRWFFRLGSMHSHTLLCLIKPLHCRHQLLAYHYWASGTEHRNSPGLWEPSPCRSFGFACTLTIFISDTGHKAVSTTYCLNLFGGCLAWGMRCKLGYLIAIEPLYHPPWTTLYICWQLSTVYWSDNNDSLHYLVDFETPWTLWIVDMHGTKKPFCVDWNIFRERNAERSHSEIHSQPKTRTR